LDAPPLIPPVLLPPIAINHYGVILPVLFGIFRMSLAPLLLAVEHNLRVFGIGLNLLPMIIPPPTLLAPSIATHCLLRAVLGGLKDLLTVTTTAARQHERVHLLRVRSKQNSEQTKTVALQNIETFIEFLPRPRRWGWDHWLRRYPAKSAPFLTGPNNRAQRHDLT
jgi:hypothetical protein